MSKKGQLLGQKGEREAVKYLKRKGYKIIETNWYAKWAELDIVAVEDDTLVFVEVKTREKGSLDSPEEAMTDKKIKTVTRSAKLYKIKHPNTPDAMRIDFVGVIVDGEDIESINLIKNITG